MSSRGRARSDELLGMSHITRNLNQIQPESVPDEKLQPGSVPAQGVSGPKFNLQPSQIIIVRSLMAFVFYLSIMGHGKVFPVAAISFQRNTHICMLEATRALEISTFAIRIELCTE